MEVQHNQIAKLSVLQGALSGAISLRTLVAQPNPFDAIDEVSINNAGHEFLVVGPVCSQTSPFSIALSSACISNAGHEYLVVEPVSSQTPSSFLF